MKRGILYTLMALAMVMVLTIVMAAPVAASEIQASKEEVPALQAPAYYVGDIIYYEMRVTNPAGNTETNTLTSIQDILPDGTVIDFLDPGETLIQAPGDEAFFYAEYTVRVEDVVFWPPLGYYVVRNVFEVEGFDTRADDVFIRVTRNTQVLRPELSIEKLVDFDGDGIFTNSETNYAGEPAEWAIVVRNTGFDPVYDIYVSDDNVGVDFHGPFDLLPGESEIVPVYTTYPEVDTVNTACAQGLDDLGNPVGPVCDPAEVFVLIEDLDVSKTVETYFEREHLWDIDKWVVTENGYIWDGDEGSPKIWLYEGGSGDETATWWVCVSYEGWEDHDFNVSGTVTIENTGNAPAVITGVEDLLGGTPIDVEFGVEFPYTLGVGETLEGTYYEDGYFEGLNEVTVTTERDDYFADAEIVWGEPDEELYECVTIVDDSEFLDDPVLGEFCADDHGCFFYEHFFTWLDFEPNGPYIFDNTAEIVETGHTAEARLVINVPFEDLEVTKTVETYFERTHEWDIRKWVETENGHIWDGDEASPKIWLYEDGSGDETASWHVCVEYVGYEDHDHNVSGTITITNTGTQDALIVSVVDYLCGDEIDIVWPEGTEFPYLLEQGETLVGTYSSDTFCDEFNVVTVTTNLYEYSATEPVVWGDPDEEHLDVVNIEDDSDIFGLVELGELDAADFEPGDEHCFTYDNFFSRAAEEYEPNGPHFVDNTAEIVETGQTAEARLVINVPFEDLLVEKTVDTYFERTHEWDIDKTVETENGHIWDGDEESPKIWLYWDGSGDETATWEVCVTYVGYDDHDHNVSGTITITNDGTADAVITGVVDLLCGEEIDIVWPDGTTFPYTLEPGQSLVGTYSEDTDCDGFNVVTVTTTVDEYASEEMAVVWGDPDEEYLKVINVEDDSDIFGLVELGELDAADFEPGDEYCFDPYDNFFAWTDYDEEGPYIYDNTAEIMETGQTASARVVINWEPGLYEICGFKYAAWEGELIPLASWNITIEIWVDGDFEYYDSVLTGADGSYCFTDLEEGTYRVSEVLKEDWKQVYPEDYVYIVVLPNGDAPELSYDFHNTPVFECYDDTIWAYGGDQEGAEVQDNGTWVVRHNNKIPGNPSNAWGWTNYITSLEDAEYIWELWAGAGQNDTTRGTQVGTLTVAVNSASGCVTVAYNLDEPYELTEAHLWIGDTPLPEETVRRGRSTTTQPTAAPGQFPYHIDDFDYVSADGRNATIEICGFDLDDDGGFWVSAHGVVEWCEGAVFQLTMSVIGQGQALGAGLYPGGMAVNIEAIPDEGHIFQFWSAPASSFGDEFAEVTTFVMPFEDVTVTARFMPEGEFEERDRDHTHLCVNQSGGSGIMVDTWNITQVAEGTVLDFYFHALTMPDRWTIWYGGEVVFSSGWVSTNPANWSGHPLFEAEGVQHHYWHPNVVASTWMTWGGSHPEGGLYAGIITKEAGKDVVVIRTEGGEPGTAWYYKLCDQSP